MRLTLVAFFFAALFGLLVSADAPEPPSDLEIQTTYMPAECPVKATNGDILKVHYTGKLFSNGNKFDSSYDRNKPFSVTLGRGQVIKGWELGLQGMCEGERRTLTIPPHLAYGNRAMGSAIPANSALDFDVELMELDARGKRDEL
ncbi:uncharacterized protein C8Q71DRAFT_748722 [Rhodofomes roseus]|uniref:peptidylprolyl isomerase n=1 Tax=Rhodofomes roseus TaxID=34475 RepID=A0A4Y9XZJ6_9APHY|nr:uncharacterized protein C8Q71DRAFT_748722 [Rhodofomes roseus]KAH9839250.1 hypothetical protein C8Q71DRAFT_748722 [Rhodofomes roseus]TFY55515.1 hypothetical protein EVJ58_g8200 [Rhodofomes roseus]